MSESQNELIARRREELEALRARGVEPYPYDFPVTGSSREILATFSDDAPQRTVSVAGRIMTIRRMGKASFVHILDAEGRIQIYIKSNDAANYEDF
ncbi:MAG TPA: OB-fold nucleic acid binding domain-containing protein, partial [Candidatus Kapabacteria bacterium]|nr:OB-fold nucleic acid binding domain-containing protein [Candidatus Kapabacteria bacterium]